jgi:hypothetical protein
MQLFCCGLRPAREPDKALRPFLNPLPAYRLAFRCYHCALQRRTEWSRRQRPDERGTHLLGRFALPHACDREPCPRKRRLDHMKIGGALLSPDACRSDRVTSARCLAAAALRDVRSSPSAAEPEQGGPVALLRPASEPGCSLIPR